MLNDPMYMTLINVISSVYEISARCFGFHKDRFYRKVCVCCRYKDDVLALPQIPAVTRHSMVVFELTSGLLDIALPTALAAGFYLTKYTSSTTQPKGIGFWLLSLFLQYASELMADFVVTMCGPSKPYHSGKEHLVKKLPLFIGSYLIYLCAQQLMFIFWAGMAWTVNEDGVCVTIARSPASHW